MATIRKRGNSYLIRVSCGYDTKGAQIVRSMTWTPDAKLTAKQEQKELERQAVMFEEKCRNGIYMDGHIKLADFTEKWFVDYAEKQLRKQTLARYKDLLERINEHLGHLRIDRIQPHHIIEFNNALAENGIRKDIKYRADADFYQRMKKEKLTRAALSRKAGVSLQVIKACIDGKTISRASADKIKAVFSCVFIPQSADKPLSDKTVQHHYRLLSTILSTAVEWQLINSNPCERVKAPKVQRKEAEYLDEKQAQELIQCLDKEPLKFRTAIMLLLYSGMRRGELCGLTWDDIDFEHNLISITKSNQYLPNIGVYEDATKNKSSERVIQIPADMIKLLKVYRAEQMQQRLMLGDQWQGSDKIFTTFSGAPIHPDTLTGWFQKFIKKYNLPDAHIHSLRHTNATLLIANGTNIRTVANRLGHANTTTTGNIYAHAIKTADEAASETLANIFNTSKSS